MSNNFGFNVWTKNSPKDYIRLFAEYSDKRNTPVVGIVDDILPEVRFGRSPKDTLVMNQAYYNYMKEAGFADVLFVSKLVPDRNKDLQRIIDIGRRVSIAEFIGLLPEQKRQKQASLGLDEMVDACWQLHTLEVGMAAGGIKSYLTGKRSTALFRLAKQKINEFNFEIIDE